MIMHKNQIVFDVAVGGALALLLLSIFAVDRLLISATPTDGGKNQVAGGGSTLLGTNPHIAGQIKALGKLERLQKLKVVKLTTKAKFATSPNINDITLMWCWEPNIIIRLQEDNPFLANQLPILLNQGGPGGVQQALQNSKMKFDFSSKPGLEFQYEQEFLALVTTKDFQALVSTVVLLEGKQAFQILNKKLSLPIKPIHATSLRNLCFALSISNLIPIEKHNFKITPGEAQMIGGKRCDQFTVQDHDGLQLQFYFDQETKLLARISHMGHDPRPFQDPNKQAHWEHNFSDYRETDGIKQWWREEVFIDSQPFSTLEVTGVQFFDDMQPDLKRPN
jgi:hypothetical protein